MDIRELYAIRTLVFVETEPQSNLYRQALLTQEQYKAMTTAISSNIIQGEDNLQTIEIELSDDIYPLPDIKDTYPQWHFHTFIVYSKHDKKGHLSLLRGKKKGLGHQNSGAKESPRSQNGTR